MKDAALLALGVLAVAVLWAGDAAWGGEMIADHTRMMDTYHLSVICESFGNSLADGSPKTWFPEFAGGHPTHALWMYGFAGPIALFWALLPMELAYVWSCIASIVFAALGMRAFLREVGVSRTAAVTGALLFALSEMFFVRTATGGANQVWALAWAPWVLRAVERVIAGKPRAVVALALWAGVAALAGHVQVWLFLAPVIGVYAIVRATESATPLRALRGVAIGAAFAVAVAAVQVLPTYELMSVADRPEPEAALFEAWSAPGAVIAGKVAPGLFGDRPWDYWGNQLFDHEHCGYGGAAAVFLALLGLRATRRRVFWAVVAVLGLVISLGSHNALSNALNQLPLINWARVPARAQMLTLVAAPILAAFAVHDWFDETCSTGRLRNAFVATGVLATGGLWIALRHAPDLESAARNAVGAAIATSAVGAMATAGALLAARARPRLGWVVAVVVGLAAVTASLPRVETTSTEFMEIDWAQHLPADARAHRVHLADLRTPYVERAGFRTYRRPAHVDTREFALLTRNPSPHFNAWMDIGVTLHRNDAAWGPPQDGFASVTWTPPVTPPAGPGLFFRSTAAGVGGRSLAKLSSGDPRLFLERQAWMVGAETKYPGSPPDRTVEVRRTTPAFAQDLTLELDAPSAGWLFVPEKHYPGWECEVNGEPATIERANVAFRAVEVPAGRAEVRFSYRPLPVRLGALLSLVSLLGLLVLRLRPGGSVPDPAPGEQR